MVNFELSSIGIVTMWSQDGSSAGLWNCAKYGWRRASTAVSLFQIKLKKIVHQVCGLITSSRKQLIAWFKSRLVSLSTVREKHKFARLTSRARRNFVGGKDSSMVSAKGERVARKSSNDGRPVTYRCDDLLARVIERKSEICTPPWCDPVDS